MRPFVALAIAVAGLQPLSTQPAKILTVEHRVAVKSIVPAIAGQPSILLCASASAIPGQLTNLGPDWTDIDAVVEHIRRLRKVEKVSLVAWSLGGPRAGGYAAQHPDKVHRLVLLARRS